MRRTYFIDIDGTLLKHVDDFNKLHEYPNLEALPKAREMTSFWHCKGHYIVLTTARPEGLRRLTETQLNNAGIYYDVLLMGIGQGVRYLINDCDEEGKAKAFAYNVKRNVDGLSNIQ